MFNIFNVKTRQAIIACQVFLFSSDFGCKNNSFGVHFNLSHFGYCPTGKEFEATELFY